MTVRGSHGRRGCACDDAGRGKGHSRQTNEGAPRGKRLSGASHQRRAAPGGTNRAGTNGERHARDPSFLLQSHARKSRGRRRHWRAGVTARRSSISHGACGAARQGRRWRFWEPKGTASSPPATPGMSAGREAGLRVRRRPLMATLIVMATLWMMLTRGAGSTGSTVPGSPENVTVVFLNATSVKVTWDTSLGHAEKYDVVYKPTDASYRVVAVVAGNTGAVTLEGLQADRQYQVTVAAVRGGRKFRSRPVVFRTLAPSVGGVQQNPARPNQSLAPGRAVVVAATGGTFQVRGIEVCIVLLVLAVWAGAIALFFNRWGKIRMLLPYQPDYKEQMKAAAAAAAAGGGGGPGAAPGGGGGASGGSALAAGGQPASISCTQATAGQSCSQSQDSYL